MTNLVWSQARVSNYGSCILEPEKDQKEENDKQKCGTSDRKHKPGTSLGFKTLKLPDSLFSHIFSTVWIPIFDKGKGS